MSDAEACSGPITWRAQDTERWRASLDQREAAMVPILDALIEAAAPRQGESVLDVGCGGGATTAALARAVRPGGTVTALDLSPELIEVARQRVPDPAIAWVAGDATTVDLPVAAYDLVTSRFGVMFFAEPARAFAHLLALTRPAGRLVVAVWPPRSQIEQFQRGYAAAVEAARERRLDYEEPDEGRGPFSLGDPDHVSALLSHAGWSQVVVDTVDVTMVSAGPSEDPGQVARDLVQLGHAGVVVDTVPRDRRDEVIEAATALLTPRLRARWTDHGLRLAARVRIVSARRP